MEVSEPWSQQAAWQALLALRPRLRRFASGLTGSLDEADDLVQAVYERAVERHLWWSQAHAFTAGCSRSRTASGSAASGMPRSVAGTVSRWIPIHGGLHASGRGEACLADVRRLVAELPADQRAALMLVAVDGLTYADAADAERSAWDRGEPGGAGAFGFGIGHGRQGGREPGARAGVGEEWVMTARTIWPRWWPIWTASLKPSSAGEVEAALAVDPELRAQLTSLERVDTALAAAFDPILAAPLPALALTERPSLLSAPRTFAGRTANRLAWAAGVGGLIVGVRGRSVRPTAPASGGARGGGRDRIATARDPGERAQRHHRRVQRPDAGYLGHGPADQHLHQRRRPLLPRPRRRPATSRAG